MKNTFKNIAIGAAFYLNGNYCIKRSSRTADVWYDGPGSKYMGWWYVKEHEICTSRP